MSSTTRRAPSAPAPWKSTFLSHISKMGSPEFMLATVAVAPSNSPTPYLPRLRTCIFRGMWAELPENDKNTAPKNPQVYESELPMFTTDVRMEKVGQLFASGSGHATKEEQVMGSGGGGPMEALWWVGDTGTQWRIRGQAYVVHDADIEGGEDSGVRTVKSELGSMMRCVDPGREGEWSWEREVDAVFGNQSPGMRGSFRAPPPGRPVDAPYDKELKLGEKVTSNDDPIARKNFRVVIIKPEEVEQLDLSDPATARRHKYTFNQETAEWTVEELWP